MKIEKYTLKLTLSDGRTIDVEKAYNFANSLDSLDNLESQVSAIGHDVLSDLEHELLTQMSISFVGEKNQE